MSFDWNSAYERLTQPFEASEIEWRVGQISKDKTRGQALPYISNRAIQNRLDEVFGINNWKNEYSLIKDGVLIRKKNNKGELTDNYNKDAWLCGISVWDPDKKDWITKWDGAENTDFEQVKGGLSSAMKRAAVQWGIGRYLYDIPEMWVDVEPVGSKPSYRLKYIPTLPDWALPGGSGKPPTKEKWESREEVKTQQKNDDEKNFSPVCSECGEKVTEKVADFSIRNFGKTLCMKCQNKYKQGE